MKTILSQGKDYNLIKLHSYDMSYDVQDGGELEGFSDIQHFHLALIFHFDTFPERSSLRTAQVVIFLKVRMCFLPGEELKAFK